MPQYRVTLKQASSDKLSPFAQNMGITVGEYIRHVILQHIADICAAEAATESDAIDILPSQTC